MAAHLRIEPPGPIAWGSAPVRRAVPSPGSAQGSVRQFGRANRSACGWPLIADDLFRLAHDDRGKSRLHPDVTALGLAAALLAELILMGYAGIENARVIPAQTTAVPPEPIAAGVLGHLRDEGDPLKVRDWLAFLARTAHPLVGDRLLDAGHVWPRSRRVWFRTTVLYVPADMNEAAWPQARLATHLERHADLDALDIILGGLVIATGLHSMILTDTPGDVEEQLCDAVSAAPAAIRDVLAHTEAAVGDAVIDGQKRRG
jgi:hypothetical protein